MTLWRSIGPLTAYLVRTALGDRLLLALLLVMAGGAALAAFLGTTALVEQREFAAVLAAATARLAIVVALALFVCFHVRREFDGREIDLLLSRPVSRASYVVAHLAVALLFAALAAALASALVGVVARAPLAVIVLWGAGLFVETAIVVAAALFFALALRSGVASALACLALYALGRTIGLLAGVAAAESQSGALADRLLEQLTGTLALLLPRLDLLERSVWLVHGLGGEPSPGPALLQGALYVVLLGAAASIDLSRRQL